MLFTWIYMSRALKASDVAELDVMAARFAQRNQAGGITGVLMKVGDHFVQVLEGEEQALIDLIARILHDERHTDFRTLYRGRISERRFPKWSMRMMHLDQTFSVKAPAIAELRRLVKTLLRSDSVNDPELGRAVTVRMLMAIPRVIALDGGSDAGAVRSARLLAVAASPTPR